MRKETTMLTMLVKGGTYARHFGKALSFVWHHDIYSEGMVEVGACTFVLKRGDEWVLV